MVQHRYYHEFQFMEKHRKEFLKELKNLKIKKQAGYDKTNIDGSASMSFIFTMDDEQECNSFNEFIDSMLDYVYFHCFSFYEKVIPSIKDRFFLHMQIKFLETVGIYLGSLATFLSTIFIVGALQEHIGILFALTFFPSIGFIFADSKKIFDKEAPII